MGSSLTEAVTTIDLPPFLSSLLPLSSPPLSSLPQAYALLIFWFQLFCAFSSTNPIDAVNLTIFNLVYTSLPPLAVAITDQDLPKETLLANSSFYRQGRCSKVYTHWRFWLTMLDAFYQSAVVFFMAYGVSCMLPPFLCGDGPVTRPLQISEHTQFYQIHALITSKST